MKKQIITEAADKAADAVKKSTLSKWVKLLLLALIGAGAAVASFSFTGCGQTVDIDTDFGHVTINPQKTLTPSK